MSAKCLELDNIIEVGRSLIHLSWKANEMRSLIYQSQSCGVQSLLNVAGRKSVATIINVWPIAYKRVRPAI